MTQPVKPVFWYQGLFMQPQHFQQAELFAESLSSPLKQFLQPHFWGVNKMSVDEGALRGKVCALSDGEFIFQDGTWVSLSENGIIQPRSFKESWVETEKPLKVFVGLHKWDRNGANVRVAAEKGGTGPGEYGHPPQTRFLAGENPDEMKDMYQKGQVAPVKLLSYHLSLFWEQEIESAGDYHLMPLAVLEFNGQDVVLSRNYTAPAFTLSGAPLLLTSLKNIRDLVLSRCLILEEYKNPRGLTSGDLVTGYFNFLLALRTLNRYLPVLQHFLKAPHVHPWNVYGLLTQLIGELSTFTDRVDALGRLMNGTQLLTGYDHENLASCFRQAEMLIEEILSSLLVGMENIVRLFRDGHYFRAQIPPDLLDGRNMVYLLIKTSEAPDTVQEMMKHVIKASSEEEMSMLIKRALPGIPLEYRSELPPGLPRRSDMICFEVDRTSRYWQSVQKNCNICLYWAEASEETSAELAILRP
jgi:type VI secretion system protein ImpJ